MSRLAFGSIVLVLVTCGWGTHGVGQQVPAPRGELRIVDTHPWNWAWITWNIFEHLVELDKDGTLVPRLATGWRWLDDRTLEMTLRHGVQFHNGEAFDAASGQLNWDQYHQLRQPHRAGTYMNFQPGSKLEILDPYTIRLVLPEPDGAVLVKLSAMHIANRQFYRDFSWGEKSW